MAVPWFILLVFTVSKAELQVQVQNYELQFAAEFKTFLQKVYEERPYESIYLHRRQATDYVDENLQIQFEVPVISLDGNHSIYMKGNFSSELLAILCLNNMNDSPNSLGILANNLQYMRTTRVITLVNVDLERHHVQTLKKFFEACKNLKLLNVIVLHRNVFETQLYHSYTQFPEFQMETRLSTLETVYFPDRLKNLHGKTLLVLPDQLEPTNMLYYDEEGHQKFTGYLGKFMHVFERYVNCSLKLPYPFNTTNDHVIHISEIRLAVSNGSIEMGISLSADDPNMDSYSYPFELAKWLIMVPIEADVPAYQLLVSFMETGVLIVILLEYLCLSLLLVLQVNHVKGESVARIPWLEVLCNDAVTRGFLGQAFNMQRRATAGIKYIYCLATLFGIYFSTLSVAYLVILLTKPPKIKQISSFDDALTNHLRIVIAEQDIDIFKYFAGEKFWHKYKTGFAIVHTFKKFQEYRRSLYGRYAYPVLTNLWYTIHERQHYLTKKLFRLSQELSICNLMLLAIPIHENSIYKETLNHFIVRIRDVGLFSHWYHMTFYDMVKLRRISFADLSNPTSVEALSVGDFYWIWILYFTALSFCTIVFWFEWFFIHKKLNFRASQICL